MPCSFSKYLTEGTFFFDHHRYHFTLFQYSIRYLVQILARHFVGGGVYFAGSI